MDKIIVISQTLYTINKIMVEHSKNTFALELNPFERSFATNESPGSDTKSSDSKTENSSTSKSNSSNKLNLRIPNFPGIENNSNKNTTAGMSLTTPGGRKLPPLSLSPSNHLGTSLGTPGSANMWNSLLTATGTTPGGLSGIKKTGLTPNDSNMRQTIINSLNGQSSSNFNFANNMSGLSPGMLNAPVTPGFSSIFGLGQGQLYGSINGGNTSAQGVTSASAPVANSQIPPNADAEEADLSKNDDKSNRKRKSEPLKASEDSNKERKVAKETITASEQPIETIRSKTSEVGNDSKGFIYNDESRSKQKDWVQSNSDTIQEVTDTKSRKKGKDMTEEEKRKNFLERNRVAASKCRQRKKQLIKKMEDELAFYYSGYRELSVQVAQLREQLSNLKTIIIGHKECPLLISSVGGYYQLNNLIQQLNYVGQVQGRQEGGINTLSSTVPTTLSNNPLNKPVIQQQQPYIELPRESTKGNIPSNIPSNITMNMSQPDSGKVALSDSKIVNNGNGVMNYMVAKDLRNQNSGLQHEQSMRTQQVQGMPDDTMPHIQASNSKSMGDLRAIHSASNLGSLATTNPKVHDVETFNARSANSMINLSQYSLEDQRNIDTGMQRSMAQGSNINYNNAQPVSFLM